MKKRAFSLIEAMVVVGIIALLATIATPFYADYMNKSKVALAAVVLNELNTKAMALYNEGLITASTTEIILDGLTWTEEVPVTYDRSPVTSAMLAFPSSNSWAFCVYVDGLSFSGYGGPGGDGSQLCSLVAITDGVFHTYCGTWANNAAPDVPSEYLPEECNTTNILTYATP